MGGKNIKSVNQYKYLGAGEELGGWQGGHCPQNFAWPPKTFSGLFLKVLHRPLTAPLVAKLAPLVAPPNENVWLHPCLGAVLDTEVPDDKDIQRQLR